MYILILTLSAEVCVYPSVCVPTYLSSFQTNTDRRKSAMVSRGQLSFAQRRCSTLTLTILVQASMISIICRKILDIILIYSISNYHDGEGHSVLKNNHLYHLGWVESLSI